MSQRSTTVARPSRFGRESVVATSVYGERPVLALLGIGIVCMILSKAAEWTIFHSLLLSVDPWALAGPFVAYWLLEANRRAVLRTFAIGVIIGVAIKMFLPVDRSFIEPIAFGLVSMAVLSAKIAFRPSSRRSALFMTAIGLLVPIAQQICGVFQRFTTTEVMTLDSRAYLVDLSLGINPVGAVLAAVSAMPYAIRAVIIHVTTFAYAAIILMMTTYTVLHIRNESPRWRMALTSFLLAGAIGAGLYHIFPAVGPAVAFAKFPELPPAASMTPAMTYFDPDYVRNCMPSLHTTWALLIVINAAGLPDRFRGLAMLFAGLVMTATLLKGEHYLVDLIVAVPFTVAIQSAARSVIERTWPSPSFWAGSGAVAFWLYALVERVDWFLTIPGFTILATIATIGASALLAAVDGTLDIGVGKGIRRSTAAFGAWIADRPA
jgi:hypothetical protein